MLEKLLKITGKNKTERKNVALVLSSGGARGLAHIGAIEVLEEEGYHITSIAGCSMGALIGAFINYFLAKFLGRPIVYKFADSRLGHFLLIDTQKVEKAENYFRDHGAISTFVGRLITVIRQLISIPAGLSNMKLLPFTLYTFLGATIWNCVLAVLGYLAHGQKDIIEKYNSELAIALLAFGALFIGYMVWSAVKPRKKV